MTVGELNVKLSLELNSLQAQINQANAKVARMGKGWHADIGKAAKSINATLATIGIGASFSGLVAFGKQCLDLGGKIVDLSYQAGIGTDAFQNFQAAALENGATGEQVADMFGKMRKSVQEAVEGNKTLATAFDRLNLNADALKKLSPETQFELIARAVSGATDKQAAYNAAADIFGAKIAPKMMQFIDAVANGGIEKAAASIASVRLTPEQLKTLDDAGDKLQRMWENIKLIGAHVILKTADILDPGSLADIEARIKMLKELQSAGQVTYTLNGETANVDSALKNFEAMRDRKLGKTSTAVPTVDIAAEQNKQALAAEAARLEKLNAEVWQATLDAEKKSTATDKEVAASKEKVFDALRKEDAELNAIAESTRQMLDPSRQYMQQIEQINEALRANKLTTEEAAEAIAKLKAEATDASLNDFFKEIDAKQAENNRAIEEKAERAKDAARELNMTFSSAFEDAIVNGEKFSSVLDGLGKDLLRLALRKNITEPLFNAMFSSGSSGAGIFGSLIGGMFADGGRPPLGKVSVVGEDGPELFVPDVAGTVVSNRDIASAIAPSNSGDGGVTIIQNFAAGVSQSQLAEGLRQTYEAAKAGVMDSIHRRLGGFGSIMA
jgi:hypothetical protein